MITNVVNKLHTIQIIKLKKKNAVTGIGGNTRVRY